MNQAAKCSWWDRLCEGSYRATTRRLAREMEMESPKAYGEMLQDLKTPLEPAFEREMARHLDQGGFRPFRPADTLMPLMWTRFGLDDASVTEELGYPSWRETCNACPVAGRCWRATRRDADVETCRAFCPNAAVFERLVGSPS